MMIRNSLDYLRTNIIKERITKPVDDERSVKVFNYPFQALEEAGFSVDTENSDALPKGLLERYFK